jgi:isopentenyl-diphosphate delta-isomerase
VIESSTEQVILVDERDRELGFAEKLAAHRAGALHRAFSVFVFDARSRLLLQKRAATKYHSGGLWSNTACGHPRPNEATEAAARRRLREEMNVDCELREAFSFVYRAQVGGALVEHEFDHVFIGEHADDPAPDVAEVESWKWITLGELRRDLAREPQLYSAWLRLAVESAGWRRVEEIVVGTRARGGGNVETELNDNADMEGKDGEEKTGARAT